MKILVTGGTGYIGSHTCVELIQAGYEIVILDNLSNSKIMVLDRIMQITDCEEIPFYQTDIADSTQVEEIINKEKIDSVIHFAGYKAVGESCDKPLEYYQNNVSGTISLLQTLQKIKIKKLVFSSSATVYGMNENVPFKEDYPLSATNPYGRTKLMIEEILRDVYSANESWQISLLRYFNPVGAHPSGLIGEDPNGIPNNLMPFISQVAVGKREKLFVFGNDYPTADGTGVRDYIHVVDLAKGHVKAIKNLQKGCTAINLGCGKGYSVLEVLHAFEKASKKQVPFEIVDRRPGDITTSYAALQKAKKILDWEAKLNIDDMCRDAWIWQKNNPNGYEE